LTCRTVQRPSRAWSSVTASGATSRRQNAEGGAPSTDGRLDDRGVDDRDEKPVTRGNTRHPCGDAAGHITEALPSVRRRIRVAQPQGQAGRVEFLHLLERPPTPAAYVALRQLDRHFDVQSKPGRSLAARTFGTAHTRPPCRQAASERLRIGPGRRLERLIARERCRPDRSRRAVANQQYASQGAHLAEATQRVADTPLGPWLS
jgi:hypothetical protein